MKQIIVVLFLLFARFGYVTAQTAPSKTAAKTSKSAIKKDDKKNDKKISTGLKKDGTPDMRLKVNKDKKAAPTGPTKKDGTADMRYKANKKK